MVEQLYFVIVNLLWGHYSSTVCSTNIHIRLILGLWVIDAAHIQLVHIKSAHCRYMIACVQPLKVDLVVLADGCYFFFFCLLLQFSCFGRLDLIVRGIFRCCLATFFQSSNGFAIKFLIFLEYDLGLVFDWLFSFLFPINRWRAGWLDIDHSSYTTRFEVFCIFPRLVALGWSIQESPQTWKLLQLQIFPFFW